MSNFVIPRFKNCNFNNEFYAIRDVWIRTTKNLRTLPFGEWLKNHNIGERHDGSLVDQDEGYVVTEIIFKSEKQYLAFKLKYIDILTQLKYL